MSNASKSYATSTSLVVYQMFRFLSFRSEGVILHLRYLIALLGGSLHRFC